MRPNFRIDQKNVGTMGISGTASIHGGVSHPRELKKGGDRWGQTGVSVNLSPMSPTSKSGWGRRKASIHEVIPNIPVVPIKKYQSLSESYGGRE